MGDALLALEENYQASNPIGKRFNYLCTAGGTGNRTAVGGRHCSVWHRDGTVSGDCSTVCRGSEGDCRKREKAIRR